MRPGPDRDRDRLLATILEADPYLGRVLTGRIHSGRAKLNMAYANEMVIFHDRESPVVAIFAAGLGAADIEPVPRRAHPGAPGQRERQGRHERDLPR